MISAKSVRNKFLTVSSLNPPFATTMLASHNPPAKPMKSISLAAALALLSAASLSAEEASKLLPKEGVYHSITEPPCSYCSTQNRKGFIQSADRVLAWIRGKHNGGAISIRHFLAAPRVINDTYGLFFYDPDGGYVSAFKKDNGYEFYGSRGSVLPMLALASALISAGNSAV